jgi:hypothetical protein
MVVFDIKTVVFDINSELFYIKFELFYIKFVIFLRERKKKKKVWDGFAHISTNCFF